MTLSKFFPLFFLLAPLAEAQTVCTDPVTIQSLRILGVQKTQPKVVQRELPVSIPGPLCQEQISLFKDRLVRMGIFNKVEIQTEGPELVVELEERWTTIPILKFRSGGGVQQYTLGLLDPHIAGRWIEAGAQYESLGNVPSAVLWYKNPRWWDQRQELEIQAWKLNRIRVKYDQQAETAIPKNAFVQDRERLYVQYSKEHSAELLGRVALDYHSDQFKADPLPEGVTQQLTTPPSLPGATRFLIARAGFQWGLFQGEHQTLRGHQLTGWLDHGTALTSAVRDFTQWELSAIGYQPMNEKTQLAYRLIAGFTDTNVLQYWIYLGGLDRIRGFADNRFSGRSFWLGNFEIRHSLMDHPRRKLQAVAFLDSTGIGEELKDLQKVKAASAGGGLRWILPQFYRVVLRLDFARPIEKQDSESVSLGAQQFF